MASNWDANWEDEEWLKRQNAATLHSVFREAEAQGKDSAKIKKVVVDKLHAVTDFKEVNSYDLLAFLKVADDADLTVTGANNQPRDLKTEMDSVIETRTADLKNKTDLISRLNYKALLEAKKITKKDDAAAVATLNDKTRSSVVSISDAMENAQEITDAEFDAFDNADKAGALDDIADSTKEAFIKRLAELSCWDKTEGRIIEKNDNTLLNAVKSLDVYKEDGSLNDVYADCAELAGKLTFEYPEGTTEAQKADLAKAYKQQLLANAAMRATNEILKDRSFIMRHKTAEDILSAYKGEVARQFERGVVVAGLTTSQATGIMLDKITRNKNGEIEYDGGADDAVKQAIADILEGKSPINPLTLQMDTYQLDVENRKIERTLKLKKLDSKKLGFWRTAKNVVKAAADNIIKKGGWKKVAVNAAVFGSAAALMAVSGSALAIGAGVALYAGMTAVNAWVMPAYDSLSNEMYERKTKGFKARLAYLKQNFSRAFKAKREEPGFMKRAWWRSAEGAVIGGLTGGMGFLGITGWTKVFSRQGAMAAGKTGSLIRSWFSRKKAEKNLETTYSMNNFKALQTAEGYLKQDKVAFAAVVGGAVLADAVKYYAEDGVVADLVSSVKDKVAGLSGSNEEAVAETTGLEDIQDTGAVSEVKDEAGKVVETRTVTTDGEGNKVVEVKDAKGNVIGTGTQKATGTEITYNDGRKVTETVTSEGDKTVTTEYPNGVKVSQEVNTDGKVVSETTEFDVSKLSGAEKRMYLNSVSKWDNNALAHRIAELQKGGHTITPEMRKALDEAFANHANGKSVVAGFYEVIASGKVESLPEGVSAVEYVDKLTRLAQLAPIVQKDAIQIMIKDLICEDFHPSEAEIATVKNALDNIVYQKGSMECVIPARNGNLCLKTVSMFGQYVGKQQMASVELPDGSSKEVPLRTANYTTGLGYEVDCSKGTGIIKSTWVVGRLPDCGCNPIIEENVDVPEPQITPQDFSVEGGHVDGLVNTAVAPDAAEIKVNFTDPFSRATAAYANGDQDYAVESNIPDGAQYIRMDSKGGLHLWQKGAVLADSENGNHIISGAGGVESIHATALNLKMDDLGAAKVTETESGISFQYGKGKHALTFILDKDSGEMRTYLGAIKDKNEIVLDQATTARAAAALTGTMNESGLAARYHLSFGAETEQNNNGLSDYINADKKAEIEKDINQDIAGAVRRGAKDGMTTTQFETPEVVPSYTPAGLTAEQNAALLSDKAIITATGIDKNGQMVFQVQGVEGVDRLSMPALKTVSIAEGQQAAVVMDPSRMGSTDALHRSVVSIPAADGKNYTVEINTRGGAARVLDEQGNKVFLDKESSVAFAKVCKDTLEANGIKGVGNINLNPYPEGSLGDKCAKIYQATAHQQRMMNVLGGRSKS